MVFIISLAFVACTAAISRKVALLSRVCNIVGLFLPASFLIFHGLYKDRANHICTTGRRTEYPLRGRGPASSLTCGNCSDSSMDMHPWRSLMHLDADLVLAKCVQLGIFLGLEFDALLEIAFLCISTVRAAENTSIWLNLIFPLSARHNRKQ